MLVCLQYLFSSWLAEQKTTHSEKNSEWYKNGIHLIFKLDFICNLINYIKVAKILWPGKEKREVLERENKLKCYFFLGH